MNYNSNVTSLTRGDENKKDDGKAMWDLLDFGFLTDMAKVMTMGAKKYGPNTWQNAKDGKNRYFAAMMRHAAAYKEGEIVDEESELPHLAHVAINAMFLASGLLEGDNE